MPTKTPAKPKARPKRRKSNPIWGVFKFTLWVFVLTAGMVFSAVVPVKGLTLYQRGYELVHGHLPEIDNLTRDDQAALDRLVRAKSRD